MASRKLLLPSTALYQDGRGSEPMIEVGSMTPADALYMGISSVARMDGREAGGNPGILFPHSASLHAGYKSLTRHRPRRKQTCAMGICPRENAVGESPPITYSRAQSRREDRPEHDPEKWVPVFGKDHAPGRDNARGPPCACCAKSCGCRSNFRPKQSRAPS